MASLEDEGKRVVVEHARELDRLDKITKAGQAVSELRYILKRLKTFEPIVVSKLTAEMVFEINALHTAFAVSYGRLFATGSSVRLDGKRVPGELKDAHNELMGLRNKRFAHNDNHHSTTTDMDFEFDGQAFKVLPFVNLKIPVDLAQKSECLVSWVSDELRSKTENLTDRLQKSTGYKWKVMLPSENSTRDL